MVQKELVRRRVERMNTLATLPAIMKNLLKVLDDPKSSLKDMGDFITKDPILTSRILRAVNSPIYGFVSRVNSVTQALLLLGSATAKGLLLSVCVSEMMQQTMAGLWEHSAGSAVMAKLLARRKGLKEVEEIAIAALLHDVGKVFLALAFPAEYKAVLSAADQSAVLVSEAERNQFGATHAEVLTWVADRWNFPKGLTETIQYHHNPGRAKTAQLPAAIVHFADMLIRQRNFGFPGDSLVPTLDEKARQMLEPSEMMTEEILAEAEELLPQIAELTAPD